jgi:hypothetical protein
MATTVASRHTRSGSQERQRRQTLEYRTTSSNARADGSKSLTFLAYIRLSTGAYNAAVSVLCNLKSLTMRDVRKMMPGAK